MSENRLLELKVYLGKQQYPETLIDNGIRKAIEKGPVCNLERQDKDVIPFITTYNPNNTNLISIVRLHDSILRQSEKMSKVLESKRIVNCKRQSKNLRQYLCMSKFDIIQEQYSVRKCAVSRCATCYTIVEGQSFTFKNGKTFTVKHSMSCKSKYVVYSIICEHCGDFYIGQTSCELRIRMTVHRQQAKTDSLRFLRVSKHLNVCSNNRFLVFPLYKVYPESGILLDKKEKSIINLLNPPLNSNV